MSDFHLPLERIETRIRASKCIYMYIYIYICLSKRVYASTDLGTNLVATLSSLDMHDFPHLCNGKRKEKRHENFNYGQTKTEISIEHPHGGGPWDTQGRGKNPWILDSMVSIYQKRFGQTETDERQFLLGDAKDRV